MTSIINLDDTANTFITRLPDGTFSISDSITAVVSDPDGIQDISRVYFQIYHPGNANPDAKQLLIKSGNIAVSGGGEGLIFTGKLSFNIDRSQTGIYRVEVFAVDKSNSISNTLLRPVIITVNNRPPHLGIPSYREYSPPGSDSATFTFFVAATDSDGIEDISSVTVQPLFASDTSVKSMYDDGLPEHADNVPGDGIYSTRFSIDTASLSLIEFRFLGKDKSGALSNIVRRTLHNRPPAFLNLDVPDSIQRPLSGVVVVQFSATVTDLDSLSDIDSVYFRNFSSINPLNIFQMYDDGNFAQHGDSTANDGIYSFLAQVDPSTSLGVKEFHFYVVDKAGARDERIKYITIY